MTEQIGLGVGARRNLISVLPMVLLRSSIQKMVQGFILRPTKKPLLKTTKTAMGI